MKRSLVAATALLVGGCSRQAAPTPRAVYDQASGKLARVEYALGSSRRNNAVAFMDGTRVMWIELDLTGNGRPERWDHYKSDGTLDRVALASRDDGVPDALAYYGSGGQLLRIERSTARDGQYNRIEHYEGGSLARSEEDTNRDGRPDKWETYAPVVAPRRGEPAYSVVTVAFDDSGRGAPQRRLTFGDGGAVILVETDPDGYGLFRVREPGRSDDRR